MSDHSDHEEEAAAEELRSRVRVVDRNVDSETLRIMVSTDNHLGYMEKDPIRGNDSFAAFEEVLILAKKYNVSTFCTSQRSIRTPYSIFPTPLF